jgi:N-acetylmuramoyl-L-alanine amidase
VYFHSGSYKYTSGNFNDIDAALLLRKEMISKGYKDAFIVAFKGKNRITIDEAKRLTGKK